MTFQQLQAELVQAMKEQNKVKKTVIADMITCAKNIAIQEGCKDNISEEITHAAILKSKRICQEQINTCPVSRPDLLEAYVVCMSYIDELAPKMLSENEIRAIVKEIFSQNEIPNRGIAMKLVMSRLKGKADGKMINNIVMEVLNGQNI